MKRKVCGDTVAVRLYPGEELTAALKEVCEQERIVFGTVSGIGACDRAVTSIYNVEDKRYEDLCVEKRLEMVGLTGNISTKEGKVYLHLHASFSDTEGTLFGGHLKEARISATGEIFLRRLPGAAERVLDETTGLNVLDF